MKKKSSLITLVIAIIVIVFGIFVYQKYLAPLYANNLGQNATIHLSKDKKVAFGKISGQENIFGIEIEITGKTKSNFGLKISNAESLVHNARIKGGKKVDFVYKVDWYSDSVYFEFETEPFESGVLDVEYRFLGMK